MKGIGIFLLVMAGFAFFGFISAVGQGVGDAAASMIGTVIMNAGLGAYLIHRANQKEQEKKEKDEWNQ